MVIDMIRRKRLVSSIMAGIMSGLLVVGNIGAFPETESWRRRILLCRQKTFIQQ